ncbi:MazG family protein [Synechococcus sp. PCC 7335]|uniref:nucleoside triphosphate pyrophosphohydrolase n=1 Tax=Synechococcus sp. (strain ATCC 29403 / PCC 7335) TaxID=91464 RepID=UPI00017ECB27|nr:nucleoside triphosphate pyrophosphohydrolase [Synechococcus sp. PCC 7335]EDX86424.1 MazG family protein [Synechococcus sp. PCC 7335]
MAPSLPSSLPKPQDSSAQPTETQTLLELQRLIDVIAQLRNPEGGCPWDLAQTPQSLTPYIIEEAYETVDAIQTGKTKDVAEELGDLLLQVVLQAQIFQEQGDFNLGDIAKGIADKMIRRHPHVFENQTDEATDKTPEAISTTWEQIKSAEKADTEDPNKLSPKLRRYARSLPPLTGAMKISQKAAKAGFEWDSLSGVWAKVDEEIAELQQAIQSETTTAQESELGDVLFSLIQIARWQGLDPTAALQGTNRRFIQRFASVEAQAQKPLHSYDLAELNALWQQAKQQIAAQSIVSEPSASESSH